MNAEMTKINHFEAILTLSHLNAVRERRKDKKGTVTFSPRVGKKITWNFFAH